MAPCSLVEIYDAVDDCATSNFWSILKAGALISYKNPYTLPDCTVSKCNTMNILGMCQVLNIQLYIKLYIHAYNHT